MVLPISATLPQGSGGYRGDGYSELVHRCILRSGCKAFAEFCALLGGTLALDIDWIKVADKTGALTLSAVAYVRGKLDDLNDRRKLRKEKNKRSIQIAEHVEKEKRRVPPMIKPPKLLDSSSKKAEKEKQQHLFELPRAYANAPLELLDPPTSGGPRGYSNSELESLSRLLELKLADFGITAEVMSVYPARGNTL